MKFKKAIIFSLSFISLFTTSLLISKPVSAHSYYWWQTPRKVVVTEPHKIYEIQVTNPRYKSYQIKTKTLKMGQEIKIQHVASYYWLVTGKGLANGYFGNSYGRFWVTGKDGWYDPYQKHIYLDTGLFTNHKRRKNKAYTFTWNQYKKVVKKGLWYHDINDKPYWNKLNKYVKSMGITAK